VTTAYPLKWPDHWPRTTMRKRAKFSTGSRQYSQTTPGYSYVAKKELSISDGTKRVLAQLRTFGVREGQWVISTNLELRNDGLPRSGQRMPADPGVAVYWTRGGKQNVMAIDLYDRVADNLAAIAATLDAMRAIERHGGAAILDRAFTGFMALPAPPKEPAARHWRDVLGVPNTVQTEQTLKDAYRRAASAAHPDKGGTSEAMAAVNAAYAQAKQELGFE